MRGASMANTPRSDNITIGIAAGEASGDTLAAMLIEAVRVRIRERFEEHRANDAEDCGVGADTNRHRQDGDD